jgi:hypothetical protein
LAGFSSLGAVASPDGEDDEEIVSESVHKLGDVFAMHA